MKPLARTCVSGLLLAIASSIPLAAADGDEEAFSKLVEQIQVDAAGSSEADVLVLHWRKQRESNRGIGCG